MFYAYMGNNCSTCIILYTQNVHWEGGKGIQYITADATSIGGATHPFNYASFKMLQFLGKWAPHSNDHSLKQFPSPTTLMPKLHSIIIRAM